MRKNLTQGSKKTVSTKPVAPVAMGVAHNPNYRSTPVSSFEGNTNYKLDPIATLKLVTASSFFGEPSFYEGNTRTALFEQTIDAALDYDFYATLDWAGVLRNAYYMRLNPQIIMTRAAVHPKRGEFTKQYPGAFNTFMEIVAKRPDDLTAQVEYYLSKFEDRKVHGVKASRMPGIMKRSIAHRLEQFNRYQMAKYANRGIGLIDIVRLTHAHGALINELMKTGGISIDEEDQTWRTMRSAGKSWTEIINSGITLTHQDILFQMRSIFDSVKGDTAQYIAGKFLNGVKNGKMFPYQYYIAFQQLSEDTFSNKILALDTLQEALDMSIREQPKLGGSVAVVADNSGSMNNPLKVDGHQVTAAEVANLSAIMTAYNATDGDVFSFGTTLAKLSYSKRDGIMTNAKRLADLSTGWGTNMGLFWQYAIQHKKSYDTVFVYSDMQALPVSGYGYNNEVRNMYDIVNEYRRKLNPKVNVFYVQVAGYDNSVQPDNTYRATNLSGWTGKEVMYAAAVNAVWDEVDSK